MSKIFKVGQRREKFFGDARGIPLDGNAKARIVAYVKAFNGRAKQKGQHKGPITRAFMEVFLTLLWKFHNSKTGLCFPSYERIAETAGCCRDTVYEAIKMLEAIGILTWDHRIARIRSSEPLRCRFGGEHRLGWRIIRTSNSYVFRDPLPCADNERSSKSENPTGTKIQDLPSLRPPQFPKKQSLIDPESGLHRRLVSLGQALGALPEGSTI
ncbi:MAG: helix-turn-helix domain-containing protein [Alphaproteobacteria bacterium]|nr:helix-turn-helix domain-containing protein [Alphaproteobacteria bacterium]